MPIIYTYGTPGQECTNELAAMHPWNDNDITMSKNTFLENYNWKTGFQTVGKVGA